MPVGFERKVVRRPDNVRVVLGPVIARGSRSNVHAYGQHAIAKVPLATMPEGWIRFEVTYSSAVHAAGGPAPRVLGVELIDGREVALFERIDGPSMWDAVSENPKNGAHYGLELARLHADVLQICPPVMLPAREGRLACKIKEAAQVVDPLVFDPLSVLPLLPVRAEQIALCHGDLHPKNVILSPKGPVLVDWFDVARGDPCGDVARASLLLSGHHGSAFPTTHLPGASNAVLDALLRAYLLEITRQLLISPEELAHWQLIEAAARLSEGVELAPLLAVLSRFKEKGTDSPSLGSALPKG
jgi:Phosphotransferase enzyme family